MSLGMVSRSMRSPEHHA
jgi:hypothetical protein